MGLTACKSEAAEMTASDWSKQAAVTVLFAIDYSQTMDIKNHRDLEEKNPLLGKHPGDAKVRNYFIGAALTHAAVTYMLPTEYRKWWLDGTIVLELAVVGNNKRIGLSSKF